LKKRHQMALALHKASGAWGPSEYKSFSMIPSFMADSLLAQVDAVLEVYNS